MAKLQLPYKLVNRSYYILTKIFKLRRDQLEHRHTLTQLSVEIGSTAKSSVGELWRQVLDGQEVCTGGGLLAQAW